MRAREGAGLKSYSGVFKNRSSIVARLMAFDGGLLVKK
jgi:hypothetical protein